MVPLCAAAQEFTDVPESSPLYPAVEYMKEKGMLRADTAFNPNNKLTRAEAVKVLVAPLLNADELVQVEASMFEDVSADEWYMPYAEAARMLGIVDSAPKFNPDAPVTKAAFMKMLLSSKKLDPNGAFSDFKKPLSSDVEDASAWFYPILRYGLAVSMTAVTNEGLLSPGREISRSDMALLYYRLEMYREGRRTQALLSQAETDIGNVLQMLDAKNIEQAEWASARAIIAARGALAAKPSEPIVKGAMKISEGFEALVLSYKAGISGDLDTAIDKAKEAYGLADKARTFAPGLDTIVTQMQAIAKNMADEARALKAQPVQ